MPRAGPRPGLFLARGNSRGGGGNSRVMLTYSSLRFSLAAVFVSLGACDPGYHIDVAVRVPAAVVTSFSEADRGLLLLRRASDEGSPEIRAWGVVCGGAEIVWESTVDDLGFAPESTFTAWIDALPEGDARACGASEEFIVDDRRIAADVPQGEGRAAANDVSAAVEIVVEFPG